MSTTERLRELYEAYLHAPLEGRLMEPNLLTLYEATFGALPALLDVAEAAEVVSDPMVADGGGDRWWSAHDDLRAALERLEGAS